MVQVPETDAYSPPRHIAAKVKRRLTQWRAAAPLRAVPDRPVISFTFDDFPVSAAQYGAEILETYDARGCFYAATGLAGTDGPSGKLFDERHVFDLSGRGHEIGAHTVSHVDCAAISTGKALNEISHNIDQLKAMGADGSIRQFAYPFGETHGALKSALIPRFDGARGILPGVNTKGSDAMQLRAVELDQDASSIARAHGAIEQVARKGGWLIFFTHDVRERPSAWGVGTNAFRQLVRRARDSGADLLTPSQTFDLMAEAQT